MKEDEKIKQDFNQRVPINLVDELLILPGDMKSKENKIQAIKFKIADLKKKVEKWELNELEKIYLQVGSDGKRVYSNEKLREAELERRKDASPEIKKLYAELYENEIKLESELIEFRYMDRRYSALRNIANIFCTR